MDIRAGGDQRGDHGIRGGDQLSGQWQPHRWRCYSVSQRVYHRRQSGRDQPNLAHVVPESHLPWAARVAHGGGQRDRHHALGHSWQGAQLPGLPAAGWPAAQFHFFLDETGHTFRARFGTTWAPIGQPPVLKRISQRREVSSIAALVVPLGGPVRLYARRSPSSVHGEQARNKHLSGPNVYQRAGPFPDSLVIGTADHLVVDSEVITNANREFTA